MAVDFFDDAESAASKYAFKCHRRTEGGKDIVYPVNALGACLSCIELRCAIYAALTRSARFEAFHPGFGTFATGGCDGYVNIWDGAAKKRLFVLPKYPSSVAALSFNHDGSLLVCNGAVATLKRSMLTPGAAPSLSGCCVVIHV